MAAPPNPPGNEKLSFEIKDLRGHPGADTDFAEARESGPPILCRRRVPEKRAQVYAIIPALL